MFLFVCNQSADATLKTTGLIYPDNEILIYLITLFVAGLIVRFLRCRKNSTLKGSWIAWVRPHRAHGLVAPAKKNAPRQNLTTRDDSEGLNTEPPEHASRWNRKDTVLLVLVTAAALAIRLLTITLQDITAEEAQSLDPFFFSQPFTRWENLFNPPLFRLIIHLNSWSQPQTLFQIRLPSVIFGALTVAVVYFMVRRHSSRVVALIASLLLAFFPIHIEYSNLERSYALWLLLILIGQLAFEGEEDHCFLAWPIYYISTFLAVLTHYLTAPYILAQGLYAYRRRGEKNAWRNWKPAALPSLAALLPFAVNMATHQQEFLNAQVRPDGAYLPTVAAQLRTVVLNGGLAGVLLLTAVPLFFYLRRSYETKKALHSPSSAHRPTSTHTSGRLMAGLAGLMVSLILGTEGRKYSLPAVVLLFLWAAPEAFHSAGEVGKHKRWVPVSIIALACLLFLVFPGLSALQTWRSGGLRELVRKSSLSQAGKEKGSDATPPFSSHLAVYPRSEFYPVFHTVTLRRDPWKNPCPSPQKFWTGCHNGRWIFAIHETLNSKQLERLLKNFGSFELLYVAPTNHPVTDRNAGTVKKWIRSNCVLRLQEPSKKEGQPHRLFSCSAPGDNTTSGSNQDRELCPLAKSS